MTTRFKPLIGVLIAMLVGIAMDRSYQRMSAPSGLTMPGVVDTGFLTEMAIHHDQAVTMSMIALQQGTPTIRAVAASIVGTQMEEIGRMRGWLANADLPELPTGPLAQWMLRDADPEVVRFAALCRSGAMPGMASVQELDELRTLSAEPFDIRFLQLIIRHHQGALPMARYAAHKAEHDSVRRLAARIAFEQPHEIARLLQMLSKHDAKPLPSGLGLPPLEL